MLIAHAQTTFHHILKLIVAPKGGVYTCFADNGFGPQPVTKAVKLEVHCEFFIPSIIISTLHNHWHRYTEFTCKL